MKRTKDELREQLASAMTPPGPTSPFYQLLADLIDSLPDD